MIPGTPKDLLTYVAGLTKIRLLPWVVLTSIARIPSVVTSTISGNALGLERYGLAIIVFAATALVSGAGMLLYHRSQKKRAMREAGKALAAQPVEEHPSQACPRRRQPRFAAPAGAVAGVTCRGEHARTGSVMEVDKTAL